MKHTIDNDVDNDRLIVSDTVVSTQAYAAAVSGKEVSVELYRDSCINQYEELSRMRR